MTDTKKKTDDSTKTDSVTAWCDTCDTHTTFSDDSPYGTCFCS